MLQVRVLSLRPKLVLDAQNISLFLQELGCFFVHHACLLVQKFTAIFDLNAIFGDKTPFLADF